MANRPSQPCRWCSGRGIARRVGYHPALTTFPEPEEVCEVCGGLGKVTIREARARGWTPIVRRSRTPQALPQTLNFEPAPGPELSQKFVSRMVARIWPIIAQNTPSRRRAV